MEKRRDPERREEEQLCNRFLISTIMVEWNDFLNILDIQPRLSAVHRAISSLGT